ncbi:MAG: IS1 family transposase [Chloroflexi bacterium]|nr:MAG: IS1 family transposase [Chloroflexota bacterium]
MNKLTTEKRTQIVACLVEGNSIRSTVRMTEAAKNTVTKLLVDLGQACSKYQDETLRNLECSSIQVDEIWSFCYSKQKNVPEDKQGQFGYGDVWTWTSICADSKLVPSWMIGGRDSEWANVFMNDLTSRLKHRVQLSSDGHKTYLEAVEGALGCEVDHAMLIKMYGKSLEGERRYSPSEYIGTEFRKITGNPDPQKASTSYVERNSLTMRMGMRRFTRLTNAFSKKVENLECAVALHFMYYNFSRIHRTLKVTPAMAAGVTNKRWEIKDIVGLLA